MELRCPDCCSPEVGFAPEGAEERCCANCGARFASDAALVTVADARGATEPPRFSLAAERAAAELEGLGGAIAPVNPYSDADELNGLLDDALATGIIAVTMPGAAESPSARIYVYPMSLSDPEPTLAVDPGGGPTLLGPPLLLREEEGEDPASYTVRLLAEAVEEANRLAAQGNAEAACLDRIAAFLNRPGPWNGADVCEFVAEELRRSGRHLREE